MSRRDDLVRAREVLFHALDGDRLLQRESKDGESVSFREPAAGLVREIRAVVRELDELDSPDQEVSVVDQLAAAREARLSGAGDPAHASRRSQSRRRGRNHSAS